MEDIPKQTSSNQITPEEITEIEIDGQIIEIKIKEIELILENTVLKCFNQKEFSDFSNIKELLSYFYKNDSECFEQLEKYANSFPEYKKKFYKSIINELILEIFKQSPEKLVKQIFDNLNKIRSNINKKYINLDKFNKLLEEQFGTKDIPKFLILNDLKYIEFRYNIQEKEKNSIEFKTIVEYYVKLKIGKMIPFECFKDKNILFNIFVLSNAKDVGSDKLIEDLFFQNFAEIRSWFNLNQDLKEYQNIFTNFIDITELEQKSYLESFLSQLNLELSKNNNKEDDLFLSLISSFFYCIVHKMKDIKKNNNGINDINSKIINFLKNTIETLYSYIKSYKYNIKILINLLFEYAINNNNNNEGENKINDNENYNCPIDIFIQEENIDYDFELIEEIISHCNNNNLKQRFQQVKSKFKIDSIQVSKSLIGNLFQKVSDIFTSKLYYYTNFLFKNIKHRI